MLNSRVDFWAIWTDINCDRLKQNFSPERYRFERLESCPKFQLVQYEKKIHIQPSYIVTTISQREQWAALKTLDEMSRCGNDCTGLIPNTDSEPEDFLSNFGAATSIERMPNYFINLEGRSIDEILSNMSARQRAKLRNSSSEFKIEIRQFTESHAELFEMQQRTWGVTKGNFFPRNILNTLYHQTDLQLWTASDRASNKLNILIIENFPEAHFFLSAAESTQARTASLYLHWALIESLHMRGFARYNLGGGVSKNDGIETFKKSLGSSAQKRSLHVYPEKKVSMGRYFPEWLGSMTDQVTLCDAQSRDEKSHQL
jgi:hypothetical protein